MGTSLTGTTPASTYDSLLKTTDNGPITTGLKVITDGLGNDTPLALSSSQVQIGGGWTLSGNNINNLTSSNIQYVGNFFLWSAPAQTSISLSGSTGNLSLQKDSAQLGMTGNSQRIDFSGTNASLNFTNSNSAINLSATTAAINISSGTINTRNLTLTNGGQLGVANTNNTISLVNGSGASGQVLAKRAAGGYEWITPSSGASWTYSTFTVSTAPNNFSAPTFSTKKLGTQVWQQGQMTCTTATSIQNSATLNGPSFGYLGTFVQDFNAYPQFSPSDEQIGIYSSSPYYMFAFYTNSIGRWSLDRNTSGTSAATYNHKGSGTIIQGYWTYTTPSSAFNFPIIILYADSATSVSVSVGDVVTMEFNYRTI